MNCEETHAQLSAYLDGQLDEAHRRAVEAHLASCAHCRAEMATLSQAIASVARLPVVEPPPGFSQRVMARAREEAQRPSMWRSLFFPIWAKIPLHVAGALLIGGLAIYLYQANQVSLPPPEAPRSESLGAARELPAQEPESKIVGAVTKPDEKRTTGNRLERAAQSEDQQVAGAGQFQDAPQEKSAQVQRLDETMSAAAKSATAPEMTGVLKIPKPTADYELTLALKETPQETFNLKLHELIKRLNGQIIETAEPVKTAWLIIPAGRYDQFKRELASFSAIESEAQITAPPASAGAKQAPPAAAMSPEPRPLRIKLTVRPPQ